MNFAYYFDISFQETLNRHKEKPNAHKFKEKEIRQWWNEKDLLGIIHEICIKEKLSLNEVIDMIYNEIIK